MSVSKSKILVVDDVDVDNDEFQKFSDEYELIRYKLESKEQFIKDIKEKYNDIVAIWALWVGFYAIGRMDKEIVDALPDSLRVIAVASVGYDQYDIDSLNARNIKLCNCPEAVCKPVADLALFFTLAVFRYTSAFELALRQVGQTTVSRRGVAVLDKNSGKPDFESKFDKFAWGHQVGNRQVLSPSGYRVGIAGFGKIGQLSAKRLAALDMEIHYTKRNRLSKEKESALGFPVHFHDTMEELFKHSDLLLLCLPLTPETKHLVNENSIKNLPDGARIVNVGRGGLIDQKALVDALKCDKLAAAGLDVFEKEPIVEQELLDRYDVTLLPHSGGATGHAYEESQMNGLRNIREFLKSGTAPDVVN